MRPQCQSRGAYCGHDEQKLAGLVPPCEVCVYYLKTMRELAGWIQEPGTRLWTNTNKKTRKT